MNEIKWILGIGFILPICYNKEYVKLGKKRRV